MLLDETSVNLDRPVSLDMDEAAAPSAVRNTEADELETLYLNMDSHIPYDDSDPENHTENRTSHSIDLSDKEENHNETRINHNIELNESHSSPTGRSEEQSIMDKAIPIGDSDISGLPLDEDILPLSLDTIMKKEYETIKGTAVPVKYDDETITGPFYKTKDVALLLGKSEQVIRVACEEYAEFLSIHVRLSGHRDFSEKTIRQLESIFRLKQEKHFTVNQTKDYLRSQSGKIVLAGSPGEQLEKMLSIFGTKWTEAMAETMAEQLDKTFSLYEQRFNEKIEVLAQKMCEVVQMEFSSQMQLMDKNIQDHMKQSSLLLEEKAKESNENAELFDKLKKQLELLEQEKIEAENRTEKIFSAMNQEVEEKNNLLRDLEDRYSSLEKSNQELISQVQELRDNAAKKKKFRLFG